MNEDVQREWLLELLERYGRNLHSFMVLEPGLSVWRGDDAAIAYVQRGGYWVTVGGPLCAADRSAEVAHAFREDAAKSRCRVVFFGVTQPLVDRLRGSSFDSLQVGLARVGIQTLGNKPSVSRVNCVTVSANRCAMVFELVCWVRMRWPRVHRCARSSRN